MANHPGALIGLISKELVALAERYEHLQVYYDHIGEGRQRLWSFYGDKPHRWNLLSAVDILVGDSRKPKPKAALIIEIEEAGATPKKLLGDIFATALGDAIPTRDGERYAITPDTGLWVCFPANPEGHQRERDERLAKRIGSLAYGAHLPHVEFVVAERREELVQSVCDKLRGWFAGQQT